MYKNFLFCFFGLLMFDIEPRALFTFTFDRCLQPVKLILNVHTINLIKHYNVHVFKYKQSKI